jgi:pimeloyl-ACP methyl ester carboxylesterase
MAELTEAGTSRTAKAGDTTLHYNEAGQGEALILLHGGGPGASGWSNFRGNIGPLSQHYRCLLVDMPGFGKSGKPYYNEPQGAYNARALRDLLDTLKIQKAHFIGNSLGGHTALKFALDYPDRAGRLIAMAPASANMVTTTTPMPTEGIKLLQGYYRGTGPSPERLKAFIQTLVYDSSWVTDEILNERYALDRSGDHEVGEGDGAEAGPHRAAVARFRQDRPSDAADLGPRRPRGAAGRRPVHDPPHEERAAARLPAMRPLGDDREAGGIQQPLPRFPRTEIGRT